MRDKVSVFYYPEMAADLATLKKCALLFDEVHFADRPSFTLRNFGTIGTNSPLRPYEMLFRQSGFPLFVHPVDGGLLPEEGQVLVERDVNDLNFLKAYQDGLRESGPFLDINIPPNNYGAQGTNLDIRDIICQVNVVKSETEFGDPVSVFDDQRIPHFDLQTEASRYKFLVSCALTCSMKIRWGMRIRNREGWIPLADAAPYGNLLSTIYADAIGRTPTADGNIPLTDLSFAVFDEIVPANSFDQLRMEEIIEIRNRSAGPREEFLEHMTFLQSKQGDLRPGDDVGAAIQKLIVTEILPAARRYRQKLESIDDKLKGALAQGILGAVASGQSVVQVMGDLSWQNMAAIASLAGGYIGKTAIDGIIASREARRECAISYLLALG